MEAIVRTPSEAQWASGNNDNDIGDVVVRNALTLALLFPTLLKPIPAPVPTLSAHSVANVRDYLKETEVTGYPTLSRWLVLALQGLKTDHYWRPTTGVRKVGCLLTTTKAD